MIREYFDPESDGIKMIEDMIQAQSPEVDTISGATYSSEGVIDAVDAALKQSLTGSAETGPMEADPEISGWATFDSDHILQVLIYCHHDDWDRKENHDLTLTLKNLPMKGQVSITHYRIDHDHSNACAEWERQGKPDWPDDGQRAAILARAGLELFGAPEKTEIRGGRLEMSFPLPTHSISLLEIRKLP